MSVERSYFTLTTTNGFGATLVDGQSGHVTALLDHPYRYLRPGETERDLGIERRNLLAGLDIEAGGKALNDLTEADYLDQSNIIRLRHVGGSEVDVVAPFGLELNATLFAMHAPGRTGVTARIDVHLGLPPVSDPFWESTFAIVRANGTKLVAAAGDNAWVERGPGEGAVIYVGVGAVEASVDGTTGSMALTAPQDRLGFLVVYVDDPDATDAALETVRRWLGTLSPQELIARERAEWAAWRRPLPAWLTRADERRVWRQSEAVLRMAQVREPAVDGMIMASLPPGAWSIGWVRDAVYAIVGLARAGYHDEARRALDFFVGNDKVGRHKAYVGNVPYRISLTRYFGNGEEEADYADHASPNIETDGWGLVLWAARQYVEASGDLAWLDKRFGEQSVYGILRDEVAAAIAAQIEPDSHVMKPDSSIWEVHQDNAKHFIFTSVTAARGLADFAWLAHRAGHIDDHTTYAALSDRIANAIPDYFVGPDGNLLGARERGPLTDHDGAVFEYFTLQVARDPASPTSLRTYEALEALRTPSGGYSRSREPDDVYGSSEWGFVNLRAASLFHMRGQGGRARELLDLTTSRAVLHFGLIPETYGIGGLDHSQRYSGSIPMAGYGAGLYLLTQIEVAGHAPTPGASA